MYCNIYLTKFVSFDWATRPYIMIFSQSLENTTIHQTLLLLYSSFYHLVISLQDDKRYPISRVGFVGKPGSWSPISSLKGEIESFTVLLIQKFV